MTTETTYPQRKDYMDGRVPFEEYYRSVYKALHLSFKESSMLPQIKRAIARGDAHLNSIRLMHWDALAASYLNDLTKREAFKLHGDSWSLAGHVCALKQAARDAALEMMP